MSNKTNTVSVTGEVTAAGKGFAEIKTHGVCGGCSACAGKTSLSLRINTDGALKVGDRVRIGTSSVRFLKRTGLFYGLPLAAMTASALTARYVLGFSELTTAILSLASVPVCWLVIVSAFSRSKTEPDVIEKL